MVSRSVIEGIAEDEDIEDLSREDAIDARARLEALEKEGITPDWAKEDKEKKGSGPTKVQPGGTPAETYEDYTGEALKEARETAKKREAAKKEREAYQRHEQRRNQAYKRRGTKSKSKKTEREKALDKLAEQSVEASEAMSKALEGKTKTKGKGGKGKAFIREPDKPAKTTNTTKTRDKTKIDGELDGLVKGQIDALGRIERDYGGKSKRKARSATTRTGKPQKGMVDKAIESEEKFFKDLDKQIGDVAAEAEREYEGDYVYPHKKAGELEKEVAKVKKEHKKSLEAYENLVSKQEKYTGEKFKGKISAEEKRLQELRKEYREAGILDASKYEPGSVHEYRLDLSKAIEQQENYVSSLKSTKQFYESPEIQEYKQEFKEYQTDYKTYVTESENLAKELKGYEKGEKVYTEEPEFKGWKIKGGLARKAREAGEKGRHLEGLGYSIGAAGALMAKGAIEGASFFVRPAMWYKTGKTIGAGVKDVGEAIFSEAERRDLSTKAGQLGNTLTHLGQTHPLGLGGIGAELGGQIVGGLAAEKAILKGVQAVRGRSLELRRAETAELDIDQVSTRYRVKGSSKNIPEDVAKILEPEMEDLGKADELAVTGRRTMGRLDVPEEELQRFLQEKPGIRTRVMRRIRGEKPGTTTLGLAEYDEIMAGNIDDISKELSPRYTVQSKGQVTWLDDTTKGLLSPDELKKIRQGEKIEFGGRYYDEAAQRTLQPGKYKYTVRGALRQGKGYTDDLDDFIDELKLGDEGDDISKGRGPKGEAPETGPFSKKEWDLIKDLGRKRKPPTKKPPKPSPGPKRGPFTAQEWELMKEIVGKSKPTPASIVEKGSMVSGVPGMIGAAGPTVAKTKGFEPSTISRAKTPSKPTLEDLDIPRRGTGLRTGRAGPRRGGKPRTLQERRQRHKDLEEPGLEPIPQRITYPRDLERIEPMIGIGPEETQVQREKTAPEIDQEPITPPRTIQDQDQDVKPKPVIIQEPVQRIKRKPRIEPIADLINIDRPGQITPIKGIQEPKPDYTSIITPTPIGKPKITPIDIIKPKTPQFQTPTPIFPDYPEIPTPYLPLIGGPPYQTYKAKRARWMALQKWRKTWAVKDPWELLR